MAVEDLHFIYRTEDIKDEQLAALFVENKQDREIVSSLQSIEPVLLVGSRGVGKSFLLRIAENELRKNLKTKRIFPVYISFTKGTLVHTADPKQFQHWMLARICNRIFRALSTSGMLTTASSAVSILTGSSSPAIQPEKTKLEEIVDSYETSWNTPGVAVDTSGIPDIDTFKDTIEDLCRALNLDRFVLLLDEAAHIFIPEQQRQFFTLFRDLRSPYITCKAAVYPGTTFYGDSFQPIHDATILSIDRNVLDNDYVSKMRDIVTRQLGKDHPVSKGIHGDNSGNFALLAYASSGNPRVLLSTLNLAPKVKGNDVDRVIREYYRSDIWQPHERLGESYIGHKMLIDWGRQFVEEHVIPRVLDRNRRTVFENKAESSCFFWVSREVSPAVKEALRLLAYTGIVNEQTKAIKVGRSQIGTRYMVNLGCLFALAENEKPSTANSLSQFIIKNLKLDKPSEFGPKEKFYQELEKHVPAETFGETTQSEILQKQLNKSIDELDLTNWQKQSLHSAELHTIGDVLRTSRETLMEIPRVGPVKSAAMHGVAYNAVYEYLSG